MYIQEAEPRKTETRMLIFFILYYPLSFIKWKRIGKNEGCHKLKILAECNRRWPTCPVVLPHVRMKKYKPCREFFIKIIQFKELAFILKSYSSYIMVLKHPFMKQQYIYNICMLMTKFPLSNIS